MVWGRRNRQKRQGWETQPGGGRARGGRGRPGEGTPPPAVGAGAKGTGDAQQARPVWVWVSGGVLWRYVEFWKEFKTDTTIDQVKDVVRKEHLLGLDRKMMHFMYWYDGDDEWSWHPAHSDTKVGFFTENKKEGYLWLTASSKLYKKPIKHTDPKFPPAPWWGCDVRRRSPGGG